MMFQRGKPRGEKARNKRSEREREIKINQGTEWNIVKPVNLEEHCTALHTSLLQTPTDRSNLVVRVKRCVKTLQVLSF